jgi:hypothetical protein
LEGGVEGCGVAVVGGGDVVVGGWAWGVLPWCMSMPSLLLMKYQILTAPF